MIKNKILVFIFIVLAIGFYSYFVEPNRLVVMNYTIQDKELSGIKIILASDFHIKPHQQKRLKKVVKTIKFWEYIPKTIVNYIVFIYIYHFAFLINFCFCEINFYP